jgi:hypothetical protein
VDFFALIVPSRASSSASYFLHVQSILKDTHGRRLLYALLGRSAPVLCSRNATEGHRVSGRYHEEVRMIPDERRSWSSTLISVGSALCDFLSCLIFWARQEIDDDPGVEAAVAGARQDGELRVGEPFAQGEGVLHGDLLVAISDHD